METFFMGQISLFAGEFAPRGTTFCNGQLRQIQGSQDDQALFSLLGTLYGGDGRTTYGLPKMENPKDGGRYIITLQGMFPSRS